MEVPIAMEEGILREWTPFTDLMNQIPMKFQSGLSSYDLSITCIDITNEYLALGTNVGLVYWYGRQKGDLQRLRCEVSNAAITFVKIVSTVDFMVAAGNKKGQVTVFQIPKTIPDNIPESLKPKSSQEVERYTIGDLHHSEISCIEWSKNGMKLFSGDKNGLVVMTEIDFYMHLCKSSEIINETYEIVQISYYQNYLLISNVFRSIICHKKDSKWEVNQVGKKDRKSLIKLGGIFHFNYDKPNDVHIYCARPGLRLWTSDKQGNVLQTLLFKDAIANVSTDVILLNPMQRKRTVSVKEANFGPLFIFKENYIVTYNEDCLYIINPSKTPVAVAKIDKLRRILSVAVNKNEIFILEGGRSVIRLSFVPDFIVETPDHNLMSKSLTNPIKYAVNTIKDLASKESSLMSDVSEQCDHLLSALKETTQAAFTLPPLIVEGEECFEIPPVRELTADMDTNLITKMMEELICESGETDPKRINEEILNLQDPKAQKSQPCKPQTEVIYNNDILYSSKISKRVNVNAGLSSHKSVEGKPDVRKQINSESQDKATKTTKPCLMQMSFCSENRLLPEEINQDKIVEEITEKEAILAKILDLEPITLSTFEPKSPDIPSVLAMEDIPVQPLSIPRVPVNGNKKNDITANSRVAAKPSQKIIVKSEPSTTPVSQSPPKVVTIPNVWNVKEIQINPCPTDKQTLRQRSSSSNLSHESNGDGDWEII